MCDPKDYDPQVDFREKLEKLINIYSKENGSNTPDFILAVFLCDCLKTFDKITTWRTAWYANEGDNFTDEGIRK